jgi:soluble cytochrome b562
MFRIFLFLAFSFFVISCSDYDEPLEASNDEPRQDIVEDIVSNLDSETVEKIEDITEKLSNGEELDEDSVKEIIDSGVEALDEVKESITTNEKLTEEEKIEALEEIDNIELEEFQNGLDELIVLIQEVNTTINENESVEEGCLQADNMGLLPPPIPDASCK